MVLVLICIQPENWRMKFFQRMEKKLALLVLWILNSRKKGKVTIKLDPESKNRFRLSLIVPSWCRNYLAVINGKKLFWNSRKYLDIEQMWDKNTVINISFDLPVQILDGGKSYPGYIAIKYGTQVLAMDQALNPEIKRNG